MFNENSIKAEMISKVDISTLTKMFTVLNNKFEENLILELDTWAENKMNFYLKMGRKLKVEKEVSFSATSADMDKFYSLFTEEEKKVLDKLVLILRKVSYDYPVEDMILKNKINVQESHFSNEMQTPWLRGMLLLKTSLIKDGMKFSSILSKFCSKETLDKYSNFIQENQVTSGLLTLSIDPLDYMTLSLNKHNWESCIKLGGDYGEQGSTLGLMMDNCTAIQYLHNGKAYDYEIDGINFSHNSKKWRRLVYCDFSEYAFIPSRQYPYEISTENNEEVTHPINILSFEDEIEFTKLIHDVYMDIRFSGENSYVDDIPSDYGYFQKGQKLEFIIGKQLLVEGANEDERLGYWDLIMKE